MYEEGIQLGSFQVQLMLEMKLFSKQPSSHAYKKATVERGDTPYEWPQGQWHYVAAVIRCLKRYIAREVYCILQR